MSSILETHGETGVYAVLVPSSAVLLFRLMAPNWPQTVDYLLMALVLVSLCLAVVVMAASQNDRRSEPPRAQACEASRGEETTHKPAARDTLRQNRKKTDLRYQAEALRRLGDIAKRRGRPNESQEFYRRAHCRFRELGNRKAEEGVLLDLCELLEQPASETRASSPQPGTKGDSE